jgi:hypothetical protein
MVKELISQIETLSLEEISTLIESAKDIYTQKYNSQYKKVYIYPGEYIVDKIIKETGFHCYHVKPRDYSLGRGTHVIVIPIEKYSEELKEELIKKYDDKW